MNVPPRGVIKLLNQAHDQNVDASIIISGDTLTALYPTYSTYSRYCLRVAAGGKANSERSASKFYTDRIQFWAVAVLSSVASLAARHTRRRRLKLLARGGSQRPSASSADDKSMKAPTRHLKHEENTVG